MRWILPQRRLAIYLRDGFCCVYCEVDLRSVDERGITLEHIIPRSRGGDNQDTNLVTCCLSCNSARQDSRLPREAWLRAKRSARKARLELKIVKQVLRRLGKMHLAHLELRETMGRAA